MAHKNDLADWRTRRRTLQAFLRSHHGVVSTPELKDQLGFSSSAIGRLVDNGTLISHSRGVYRSGSMPSTPNGDLRCQLIRIRKRAGLARRSAAFHLGYLSYPPQVPQLVVAASHGFAREGHVERHGSPGLVDADLFEFNGLICSRPKRVILDLAQEADYEGGRLVLRRVLRGAAKQDAQLVPQLRKLADVGGFPGVQALRRELTGGMEQTLTVRSGLEDAFVELCKRYGLPIPATNVIVHGLELDAYWVEHNAYVEVSPYATHGDEISFQRDSERLATLAAAGVRGFPVTDRSMEFTPDVVAANVRRLLGL